jgi:hypothetical protein
MRRNDSMDELKETGEVTQLSAWRQPPAELKKLGWAKKKLLREVLQCKLPMSSKPLKKLAKLYGMTTEQLTIELAMNMAQIEKALAGDTHAYKTLMERAYGYPVTPILSNTDNQLKVEIVYGDKPIIENEKWLEPK